VVGSELLAVVRGPVPERLLGILLPGGTLEELLDGLDPLAGLQGLPDLVGAVVPVAVGAARERIGEVRGVAARLPHLGMHRDGGIEADHVVAAVDVVAPPQVLDVPLHLDAERTVIPRRAEAAVDLARLEDESPPLAQRDDGVEISHTCPIHVVPALSERSESKGRVQS
jgi:hypothetical protein